MRGWTLFEATFEKRLSNDVFIDNFASETLENKLHILQYLLCENFEIYYRKSSGNVCVYDRMSDEFITETSLDDENNIYVLINNLSNDLACV